jgi:alkylhydroperoxidase family enzyme
VAHISDEQLEHLSDDPLPEGLYTSREAAIIRYAQQVTRQPPRVSEQVYHGLTEHFDNQQILQLCFIVGLSAMVNRIHATFLTDVDEGTLAMLEGTACPIPLPPMPGS